MHKEAQEELDVRFKLFVLELAQNLSVTNVCQEYNVFRASFYRWKQKYKKAGRAGLFRKTPSPTAKTCPTHEAVCENGSWTPRTGRCEVFTAENQEGKLVKRYQYTAIDDATRIRALPIFPEHNQEHAIQFMDYVVERFPFRISTIRTDRGHEFQARFHWYVEDQGMRHVYIKPQTPQLNGKVERSHRTDQTEFYQLLTYKGDVDLNAKLKAWGKLLQL